MQVGGFEPAPLQEPADYAIHAILGARTLREHQLRTCALQRRVRIL